MSSSIPNSDFANQLENMIREFVKEKLELIMKEEIKNFLEVEQKEIYNSRMGITPVLWILSMGKLISFMFHEIEMGIFKPNYLNLINIAMVGSKKRLLKCTKVR